MVVWKLSGCQYKPRSILRRQELTGLPIYGRCNILLERKFNAQTVLHFYLWIIRHVYDNIKIDHDSVKKLIDITRINGNMLYIRIHKHVPLLIISDCEMTTSLKLYNFP